MDGRVTFIPAAGGRLCVVCSGAYISETQVHICEHGLIAVAAVQVDIGSDGRLLCLSETGVSDTIELYSGGE